MKISEAKSCVTQNNSIAMLLVIIVCISLIFYSFYKNTNNYLIISKFIATYNSSNSR